MDDLLRRYLKELEKGKFPEYSTIKALLQILNSDQRDDDVFRELSESFRGRYELMKGVFKSHRNLTNKVVRTPIEEERRLDIRNNRDWYASDTRSDKVSDGERRTTELISAVEIVYYLIYKSKVDAKNFPTLLAMDSESVFGLAKLISPFTDDFKILEIYLDNSNNRDGLLDQMIDYQITLLSTRDRYTRTEARNFRRLILERIDARKINEKIQYIKDFFRGEDFRMAGNLKSLFNSIILVGQVCKNLSQLGQQIDLGQIDLSLFLSHVGPRREPFILSKIEGVAKCGADSMEKDRHIKSKNDKDHLTNQQDFDNSLKALKFSLPILKYVMKNGLNTYDRALLCDQVNRILEPINQRFLEALRRIDLKAHAKLIKYLEYIRNMK